MCPAIAAHWSGGLYVVWAESSLAGSEVYIKTGTIGGPAWSANKKITWTSGSSNAPALSVDFSGNIHLVWADDTPGNVEIYYSRSTDGGGTWTAGKRLTWSAGYSYYPALAVDSLGRPLVVWQDDTLGKEEIFFRHSPDGGISWEPAQRLTWNAGSSIGPAVAVDAGRIYLVWSDDTPGNCEIFYKWGD